MTLTWPMFIVAPLLLSLLFRGQKYVVRSLAFTAPFTATSALNIGGSLDSEAGISMSWFFLLAMIGYFSLKSNIYNNDRWKINKSTFRRINLLIVIYWTLCLISLIMLFLGIESSYQKNELIFKHPGFDVSNLARFIFFTAGFFYVYLFSKKASWNDFIDSLNYYVLGSLVASLFGLLDYKFDHNFFSSIFNTSTSIYAQGFTAEGKIAGPSVEPSILVQCLGIAASISVAKIFSENKRSMKYLLPTYIAIFILLTTILLSGTHTGLAVLLALGIQIFLYIKSIIYKVFLLIIFPFSLIPFLTTLGEKMDSFSGLERLGSVIYAFDAFVNSPSFGHGFAEVTSHDLIVNSLSNTGIFATLALFTIIYYIFRVAIRFRNVLANSYAYSASFGAMLNLLTSNLVTGFAHPFVHFYIVFSLATWATFRVKALSMRSSFNASHGLIVRKEIN